MDNQASPAERELRKERMFLHPLTMREDFVPDAMLTPRDGYRRLPAIPDPSPGPPRRFILTHAFNDETILLDFHGIGAAESSGTARIWGVEPPDGGGFTGRFLCDVHFRLSPIECEGGTSRMMPPKFRFAQWVEVIDDHAPFPGILLRYKSGMEGVNPPIMLQAQWCFPAYIVELSCIAPPGSRPIRAASGMWQAVKFGPPRNIPPSGPPHTWRILGPNGEVLQEGEPGGEEWHTGGDA